MTTLRREHSKYDDVPRTTCPECDAEFHIYWSRSPLIHDIEFCPFCGTEVHEVIDVDTDALYERDTDDD